MKENSNLPDWNDAVGLIGLLMFGCGLWWISPPWALIIVGAIILAISAIRSRG